MLKTKRYLKLASILSVVVVLVVSLLLTAPMAAKDTPNPKSKNPHVTYQTIPIYMMMEAGVPFEQEWEGGGRLLHSGVGWLTPFGRARRRRKLACLRHIGVGALYASQHVHGFAVLCQSRQRPPSRLLRDFGQECLTTARQEVGCGHYVYRFPVTGNRRRITSWLQEK